MASVLELIKMIYFEGFFSNWKTAKEVKEHLAAKGFNFSDSLIHNSLTNAVKSGLLTKDKNTAGIVFSQKAPPKIKLKETDILELNKVLSEITEKKLGDRFQQDIKELNIAFTYDCGNSAAFILRKILEKAIFYVFTTHNKVECLKDKNDCFLGLEAMINTCKKEKIKGIPVLLPKNADKLLGIKFLGDSSAHDYLINIEVEDINHQLSYWTAAIKELASFL